MFRLPATRREFWEAKIAANRRRDAEADMALESAGWRRIVIWECALRGRARRPLGETFSLCAAFLSGQAMKLEFSGRWDEQLPSPSGGLAQNAQGRD